MLDERTSRHHVTVLRASPTAILRPLWRFRPLAILSYQMVMFDLYSRGREFMFPCSKVSHRDLLGLDRD